MELTFEHRVRVKAPLDVVWSECSEPDRVLRHLLALGAGAVWLERRHRRGPAQ